MKVLCLLALVGLALAAPITKPKPCNNCHPTIDAASVIESFVGSRAQAAMIGDWGDCETTDSGFKWKVDWDDGHSDAWESETLGPAQFEHTYAADGHFDVEVQYCSHTHGQPKECPDHCSPAFVGHIHVHAEDGIVGAVTKPKPCNDCHPVIDDASIIEAFSGSRAHVAMIADHGDCTVDNQGFKWKVDWDDGNSEAFEGESLGPFQAEHTYAADGHFDVEVQYCAHTHGQPKECPDHCSPVIVGHIHVHADDVSVGAVTKPKPCNDCHPTIDPATVVESFEGSRAQVAAIADWGDCEVTDQGFKWSVSWGDGFSDTFESQTIGPYQAEHSYAEDGHYDVDVKYCAHTHGQPKECPDHCAPVLKNHIHIHSDDVSVGALTKPKPCNDCHPTIDDATVIESFNGMRAQVAAIADWGDCEVTDQGFKWKVNWGDSSSESWESETIGPYQAEHAYAEAGHYDVEVKYCAHTHGQPKECPDHCSPPTTKHIHVHDDEVAQTMVISKEAIAQLVRNE